ncbi:aldose 1-epimerase family protein [Bifidobacterium sp. ESL0763]|uniref:aldose 1-epimerase family protein n=1 Tax=Bifidobacterium sp. ESL0763 TaxID=2983227 RepID=UPI0023F6CDCB|nr:aldose 1-epimerase family protein [Bifidobacterium sp. ESL0763]MDF7663362.1 aldose 1-epimerase family protein [Bifidobacterium sp. ESL0763]
MEQLQNDNFLVEVDRHGAQINHIYNRHGHFDYIWNNDLWPKHAPVLFPAIGRSNEDAYTYGGKRYDMPQHGFVSEYDFDVVESSDTKLTLRLAANAETRKLYPFDFTLSITFTLGEAGLSLSFAVGNEGDKPLSYSLGSHPAFNVPVAGEGSFEDYTLTFSPSQSKLRQFEIVKTPNPYRDGKLKEVEGFDGELPLRYRHFDDGLIIIENEGIDKVTLSSPKTSHSVSLTLSDFRYLTLWTKEGADAPFLCIEPFNGLPDVTGDLVDIMHKEGNILLDPGKTKTSSYDILLS